MQRRIDRADGDRFAMHRLEHAVEVGALQRQQLVERRPTVLLVIGQDHPLDDGEASLAEEHVLGPAQADAARAERRRRSPPGRAGRRWRGCRGGGTRRPTTAASRTAVDAESCGLHLPGDDLQDLARARRHLADLHLAGEAVEGDEVPFTDRLPADLAGAARSRSISSAPAPTTDGLPIWRPTTAACEVMPPVAVRMPWATLMPWMSSGTVSMRTRMTRLPLAGPLHRVVGGEDRLTGGRARRRGQPLGRHRSAFRAFGVEDGCRSWSATPARPAARASFGVISSSSTMSTAMCTAAKPVRLPLRVWSM